jgi:hypothetical protein
MALPRRGPPGLRRTPQIIEVTVGPGRGASPPPGLPTPLPNTSAPCKYRQVTRDEEVAEIAQFLAARGPTRCPAAYVAPTASSGLTLEEQARHIEQLGLAGLNRSPS